MVVHKDTGEIEHRIFKDIIDYFGKGDTFVFNDTRCFQPVSTARKKRPAPTSWSFSSGNSTASSICGM